MNTLNHCNDIDELVNQVCECLRSDVRRYDIDNWKSGEHPTTKIAREICHKLLNAAEANSLGGCQLCQS